MSDIILIVVIFEGCFFVFLFNARVNDGTKGKYPATKLSEGKLWGGCGVGQRFIVAVLHSALTRLLACSRPSENMRTATGRTSRADDQGPIHDETYI